MRHFTGLAVLSAFLLAVPALAQHVGVSSGTKYSDTFVDTSTAPDGVRNRDTNPAASNPDMPLPGTANPNNRAAPMVPNPMPVPEPKETVPGPGGARGSPSQPAQGWRDDLRGVRDALRKAPLSIPVADLRVFRKNGKPMMTGTVGTPEDRDTAGRIATEALGGRPVLNLLKVKP